MFVEQFNIKSPGQYGNYKMSNFSRRVIFLLTSHKVLLHPLLKYSYEQMATLGSSNKCLNCEDLLIVISDIISSHQKNFHHPILSPLKSSFTQVYCFELHLDSGLSSIREKLFQVRKFKLFLQRQEIVDRDIFKVSCEGKYQEFYCH